MRQFVTLAVVALCAIATHATPLCGGPGLLMCQPVGGLAGHGALGGLGGLGALELEAGLGLGVAPAPYALSQLGGGLPLGHLNLIKKLKYAQKPLLLSIAPVAPIAPIALAPAAPLLPQKLCGCLEPACSPCLTKK